MYVDINEIYDFQKGPHYIVRFVMDRITNVMENLIMDNWFLANITAQKVQDVGTFMVISFMKLMQKC